MADETYSRNARKDPQERDGTGASKPSTDPLIELARLIGQNNSLAAGAGRERRADPRSPEPTPGTDHRKDLSSYDRHGIASEPRHADSGHEADPGHPAQGEHRPGGHYDQHDQDEVRYADSHLRDDQAFQDDPHDEAAAAGYEDSFRNHEEGYESSRLGGDQHEHAGHENELYDDEPAPRRRGGLIAVAALVGLAVIGTAGAFAYRTVFTSATGAPPVIRADGGPNKIVPATQNADSATSKQIYDRMGDVGQNERVVSREEQPINIPDPLRTGSPRAAATVPGSPFAALPGGAPAQPVLPGAAATPQPPQPGGEPRKIRTVTIKADQPAGDAARPAAPVRPAAPQPTGASAPASPNAPLALVPQDAAANSAPARPTPARPQVAAVSRPEATAAPRPTVTNAPESGSYFVQLSAQKTEGEAQASFRSIQAKYASVLSGRQPVIRRKDLGSKGIFYGAQVGPLSRDEAVHLCDSLKSAGGSCMLQRN